MIGMNRSTGRRLTGIEHLRQSIADILTTPIGSRVMRRNYGSLLPELIDQPQNAATMVQLYAAAASALMIWELRLRLSRITYEMVGSQGVLDIEGEEAATGNALNLRVPLLQGGAA